MLPSHEEFKKSHAEWRDEYQGIGYSIAWWGHSEYSPAGVWNYYLHLLQEQFFPSDWEVLRLERSDYQVGESTRRAWNNQTFPEVEFPGGCTFAEMNTYMSRDGHEYEAIKIGCDYNHFWNRESGFPETLESVRIDAKRSIDILVGFFPIRRQRCDWSGWYADPEQFYQARNGKFVLKKYLVTFKEKAAEEECWERWLPEPALETVND